MSIAIEASQSLKSYFLNASELRIIEDVILITQCATQAIIFTALLVGFKVTFIETRPSNRKTICFNVIPKPVEESVLLKVDYERK